MAAGREVYRSKCLHCHGEGGRGDGAAAERLDPRPRDFTKGLFKFRTTATGELPTDEDLFRVVTRGVPGTAMPGFEKLPPERRRQVIHYIKTFAADFSDPALDPRQAVVPLGEPTPGGPDALERGKRLYQEESKGGCVKCHGRRGRGDGPEAGTHKDDWGFPILPADLTKPWRYKNGPGLRDIYRTLSTGMNGTPMPGYGDALSAAERWDLARYVRSLIEELPDAGERPLLAIRGAGPLPEGPEDPTWRRVSSVRVRLLGQLVARPRLFRPSIDALTFQAVHNGREIAIRLTWNDRTRSLGGSRDGAGLQFPARTDGDRLPYLLRGEADRPVVLWRWEAGKGVSALRAAGLANPPAPGDGVRVEVRASFQNGRWALTFRRLLKAGKGGFSPGGFIPVAFGLWDGGRGEGNLRRAISPWHTLYLAPEAAAPRRPPRPRPASPRIVHPMLPEQYEGLENPLRKDGKQLRHHIEAGAKVYYRNCVLCHGDELDGKGLFAPALDLKPADFADPETIGQLHESYLFWRIREGGQGLPGESQPWNSAMPAWKDALSEEEVWQVVMFLFDAIGEKPRSWR
ncbi:MAG: c-type cytochrome [Nitrospinota bacterium]